jgi:hypothetical protein
VAGAKEEEPNSVEESSSNMLDSDDGDDDDDDDSSCKVWEKDDNAWLGCVCGKIHSKAGGSQGIFWIECEAFVSPGTTYPRSVSVLKPRLQKLSRTGPAGHVLLTFYLLFGLALIFVSFF